MIHGQYAQWRAGLTPLALTKDSDRLYGRVTVNNKVQHLSNIAALETVLAVRGKPGFNVKIVLQMREEFGCSRLKQVMPALRRHPDAHAHSARMRSISAKLSLVRPVWTLITLG